MITLSRSIRCSFVGLFLPGGKGEMPDSSAYMSDDLARPICAENALLCDRISTARKVYVVRPCGAQLHCLRLTKGL
ncbi:hypothetical protein DEU56DRAFT_814373 [Suillus clintonianus]|uniref:uncharacterized protein n=1 Tax=Suillus clintonianus TaxID=1904413 RepID=UPI001B87AD0E|nr:uncharacterized protein DEU56DRAFT_814373 [Suillus clintonianus]KAG2131007.1 hypothetical protein DEU56DRAFT_814373 [Suillus clintonianus]